MSHLLTLNNVSKIFGGIRALSNVSLSVPQDRIVGVIGPNGAGKTTLFNVITGAYRATEGNIVFDGKEMAQWPSHRIMRAGVARTFQNIRLFGSMTVWEHLLVAQPHQGNMLRLVLPARFADPVAWRRAEEVLDIFGLGAHRDTVARTLSYGLQRKVEMARALTTGPKLLMLDEPVAGMNHDEAEELRVLLLRLQSQGLSILLIEHDMPFVMRLCHQLYVLNFGSLLAEGTPAEVRSNPAVLEAYLGSETVC
jgi:branched-chain amino acid transport system ATP-binding protein